MLRPVHQLLFVLISFLLIAGCTSNAKKFNEHKQVSLAALDHDLPIVLEFCEKFLINKQLDSNYLVKNGFQKSNFKSNKQSKNSLFTRDKVISKNNNSELKWGAILVETGKALEPSCGPADINTHTLIKKMDAKFKKGLRTNGYRFKNKLETVTALPKEIYIKNGDVYLVETISSKHKDYKYTELANTRFRKLKITEEYYDEIWPLVHAVRKENVYSRGYSSFQQTYFMIALFKKLYPELDLQVLISAAKNSNHNEYIAKNSWKKAHTENARIANQQATAQVQRVRQQQQVFVNQSRARNPAPPSGLRQ